MRPPHHGRNADGPDVQPARVRRGFRQDKAGLRRLEGHCGVRAHGDGARTPGQSGKAGRDIQRKNECPLLQRVDPAHQLKLQRPEAAGKARAEYPVHDDVRAAPLADGSVGIYIPRRIAVFFGPARSRGKRHAATPGQPHMLPRHAPVGPQRPGMQHKHLGASVVQMPGKTSGIPAVVAAAHEQQDALARHMTRFSRKHMQGLAGGVFHQQQFGQTQINGGPIPTGHFRRSGKRCEHTKTSRRPGCHKERAGRFSFCLTGRKARGQAALTRDGNRIKPTRETLHYLTFPQTYSNGEYHAGFPFQHPVEPYEAAGSCCRQNPVFPVRTVSGPRGPSHTAPSPFDPEEIMPSASLVKEFENLIGKENVFTSEADRQSYAYDAAVLPSVVPGLVLRPTSTEQLGALIERCYANGLPMTIRGAGTNLSGGTVPDADKSVVILTQGLNKIIEINEEDLFAIVEPGVVTAQFAAAVASKGLFYPPDPGSQAVSTIGGNIAENAGGLRGLKYGVTKDYVMGLEFYDHTGELVKSGSRTVKCATGYNLGGLLVGSEGTLGMISRAILKLVPPPQASKAMMAVFDNVQKASEAVARIIAAHILPCTLEFMDNMTINLVEDDVKIGLPRDAQAILLIEVDGHAGQVADEALIVEEQLKKSGATQIVVAKDAEEKNRIWEARRKALPALARFKPTTILEDATVPRSKIPAMMKVIKGLGEKYNLTVGTFGHAGDGNLHPTFMCDKRDKDEFERVERAVDELFNTTIEMGGTLSGEHGIGTAKQKWLEKETSRGTIGYSRRLRKAIDPKGLFNPSKLVGV